MSDLAVLALAAAVCAGAQLAAPVPRGVVLGCVLAAVVLRRPAPVVFSAALLASALACNAWAGMRPPEARLVESTAVLAGDPEYVHGAVRVDLRIGRRRVEAWAHGAHAAELRDRLMGEVVRIRGRLRAPPPAARRRLAVRHIAARLDVLEVGAWGPGTNVTRLTNGLRRTLEDGASSLPRVNRSLLLGVVLGDSRDQPTELADSFRAAGLSHLLVVSGQNVDKAGV